MILAGLHRASCIPGCHKPGTLVVKPDAASFQLWSCDYPLASTLLHISADGHPSRFVGQTCPAASVTCVARAVKPFRMASRPWNAASWGPASCGAVPSA